MGKAMWVLVSVLAAVLCAEGSPLVQMKPTPPSPFAVEKMARFILHNSGNENTHC